MSDKQFNGKEFLKMNIDEIRKRFIKIFKSLADRYSRHQIWSDFVIMSACAIANACDRQFFDVRERMYKDCTKRYRREEIEKITEMLSLTVLALEKNSEQDFLGDIFGDLRLHNEWKGQFFTPYNIAKLMAEINTKNILNDVEEKGIVSLADFCCGAGCLLIAFANSVKAAGVNYQRKIVFVAQDIDLIAGLMCYIQLSLLGCRGYVKIGDSLSNPITNNLIVDENIWFTPMYKMGDILPCIVRSNNTKNISQQYRLSA